MVVGGGKNNHVWEKLLGVCVGIQAVKVQVCPWANGGVERGVFLPALPPKSPKMSALAHGTRHTHGAQGNTCNQ